MNNEVKFLEDIVEDNMAEYSAYVLLSRAIPDIRDGLKPSHRRIIWAMEKMGARKLSKSAQISGETMKIHPHGDVYGTMVGMTQVDAHFNPYIIGKGNFGLHASDLAPASSRYSEAKLSDVAKNMIDDVSKRGVNMVKTYDGERTIPEVFPVTYPSVLGYSQSGIGVGFSSNIPSFNPTELCSAIIKYILEGEKEELIPDFTTGGSIIHNEGAIKSINQSGKGTIRMRAKTRVEDDSIYIKEVPYTTTIDKIEDRILSLHREGKLKEVKGVHNTTDIDGVGLKVTVKGNADTEQVLEKLYQNTPMESTFSANMMILGLDGLPKQMGVWEIIEEWLSWRTGVIKLELSHEVRAKKDRLNAIEGLMSIKDHLDEVIEIIRGSSEKDVEKNLMKKFPINEKQAEYIVNLKLRNTTKTYIEKLSKDVESLKEEIHERTEIINKREKLLDVIVGDLESFIEKYGSERVSEVISDEKLQEHVDSLMVDIEEAEDYNVRVYVTDEGYVKKIPLTSLRGDFSIRTKSSDYVVDSFDTKNSGELLIFTDSNNVYKKRLCELSDDKPSTLGAYMPGELGLKDENILYICVLDDDSKWLLVGYEDGRLAKIELDAYETKTNRTMLKNAYGKQKPVFMASVAEDKDILVQSTDTRTVLINTSVVSPKKSKTSQGNKVINLKPDCHTESIELVGDTEELEYYRVKNTGVGCLWKGE